MKIMHSNGLISVPVATMSTVIAMRGLYELRKPASRFSAVSPVVRYVIFLQKSLPFPNSVVDDTQYILSVGIVFGKDERFRDMLFC